MSSVKSAEDPSQLGIRFMGPVKEDFVGVGDG